MIRLIIVDDHPLVRLGIKSQLSGQTQIQIIAEAGTGQQAIALVRAHKPDIVLLDIYLPGMDGLETAHRLLRFQEAPKIIILTAYHEDPLPQRFLEAGVAGYLLKDNLPNELLIAIEQVMQGKPYVCSQVAEKLAFKHMDNSHNSPFELLTQRELQVTLLVARGYSAKEVGEMLCLSTKTVNTYRHHIFEKLMINSDVQLVRMVLKYQLLDRG